MISFNKYLVEAKNTHMEHLEDNVLNGGVDGARQSINFLQSLRDMLAGHSNVKLNTTVKWDGAKAGTAFEQAYSKLKGKIDAVWVANDTNAAAVIQVLWRHRELARGFHSKLWCAWFT